MGQVPNDWSWPTRRLRVLLLGAYLAMLCVVGVQQWWPVGAGEEGVTEGLGAVGPVLTDPMSSDLGRRRLVKGARARQGSASSRNFRDTKKSKIGQALTSAFNKLQRRRGQPNSYVDPNFDANGPPQTRQRSNAVTQRPEAAGGKQSMPLQDDRQKSPYFYQGPRAMAGDAPRGGGPMGGMGGAGGYAQLPMMGRGAFNAPGVQGEQFIPQGPAYAQGGSQPAAWVAGGLSAGPRGAGAAPPGMMGGAGLAAEGA